MSGKQFRIGGAMDRLESQSMQDSTVAQLTRAILDGSIESGTELTQVDLANSLGISRMPVREALFALEHRGLVTRLPNKHCRVCRPTRQQLERVLALCTSIETDVLADLPASTNLPTSEMAFHAALLEACGEGYPRRVLATTTSVYVSYLAQLQPEMAEQRETMLAQARMHAAEGDRAQTTYDLNAYAAQLMRACPFEKE